MQTCSVNYTILRKSESLYLEYASRNERLVHSMSQVNKGQVLAVSSQKCQCLYHKTLSTVTDLKNIFPRIVIVSNDQGGTPTFLLTSLL